jgi:hypothetical protein
VRIAVLEPLEPRRLLAGITIITHGYADNTRGWVSVMADGIAQRAGGLGAVSIYTLRVGINLQHKLGIVGFTPDANSPLFGQASSGETIIKLDWSTVNDGPGPTQPIGDVVASYLMQPHANIPALVEEPLHFIGHSRGASLNTEIVKDLGEHGIWVDQFISLDPHPIRAVNDEPMTTWSNIEFADDYWRSSPTDPINGQPVTGAFLQSLNASVEAHITDGDPHTDVHAWYYGTINLTATSDETVPIPIPSSWYGDTAAIPPRDKTGFYFSSIAGGQRPASGISTAFGGTASRVDPGKAGAQWANVTDVAVAGPAKVPAGHSLDIAFTQSDRGDASKAVIFLDLDENPFNHNTVQVFAHRNLAETANPTRTAMKFPSTGVEPGEYYVGVQITAASGLTRYDYAPQSVTIT